MSDARAGVAEGDAGAGPRLPQVPGFGRWPAVGTPKEEGKALRARVPAAPTPPWTWTPPGPTP